MTDVLAELQRRDSSLALVPWLLVADAFNVDSGLSDPVIEAALRQAIGETSNGPAVAGTAGTVVSILRRIRDLLDTAASPHLAPLSASSVAAGASTDLNAPAITAGKTGKLVRVSAAASVPMKVEIKTVFGSPVTQDVIFTSDPSLSVAWSPPAKDYLTVAGGGNFRVTVTNQDTIDAANLYCTIYYDEE